MTDASFTPQDIDYDYAIAGLPFLSASGVKLTAYTSATLDRQTAPYRKDQTDQTTEAGEQTLSFWWTRSQSSFHGGAGQKFLDGNGSTDVRRTRFEQSRGVNVFTQGEVTVLPKLTQKVTPFVGAELLIRSLNGVMYSTGSAVKYVSTTTTTVATGTSVNDIGTGSVYSLVQDGAHYYTSRDSGIYKGDLFNPASASVQIYNTTTPMRLAYVKDRLMAAPVGYPNACKLYELDTSASAAVLPTPHYTHPDTNSSWDSFTEGPQGIYVANTDGSNTSGVYLLGVEVSSGTPVLGAPERVLDLPENEYVSAALGYLGAFLVLQTNMGIRVAKIQTTGTLDVGPLTVDKTSLLNMPNDGRFTQYAKGLAGQDNFVYALVKGSCFTSRSEICLLRIDLSNEIDNGRYAWASDSCLDGGVAAGAFGTGLVFDTNRQAIVATDYCIAMTNASVPEANAFLITSRIRYSTTEPKIFERVRTEGDAPSGANGHHTPPGGNGHIRTLLFDANGNYAYTYGDWLPGAVLVRSPSGELYSVSSNEFRVENDYISKVGQYVQVEFDLFESTGTTLPDVHLRGFQLKALPAQKRQRVERLPLLCFDLERDQTGQLRGERGTAWTRLKALEAIEEAGAVVSLQRFGPNFTSADDVQVVIDDIEFIQTAVPNKTDGWGGVVMLSVRTVD